MAMIKKLSPDDIPGGVPPAGHYSPAVIHNGTVYVSGQLARIAGQPADRGPDGVGAQTTQCLRNAEAVLKAAGSGRDRVLRATLYIADIGGWAEANSAFAAFFGDHRPARSIIPVGPFKGNFLVEIDLVAALAD